MMDELNFVFFTIRLFFFSQTHYFVHSLRGDKVDERRKCMNIFLKL